MNDARTTWLQSLEHDLDQRRARHLFRELREVQSPQGPAILIDGHEYLQFCTNNYLGLACDAEVIDAAREAVARYGTGAGASRLVAGSMSLHHALEAEIARFKSTEAALLFPTGFMANLAVLTTFAGRRDLVVSDKLNHASLLDAAKFSGGTARTFPHKNYERAGELLSNDVKQAAPAAIDEPAASPIARKFLVTDSLFSMDGDLADLAAACKIAGETGSLVIIDEAHATGVLGPRGGGVAELQNVESKITLSIGTLSKALGSVGGFVAGPRAAIDTLVNNARAFIYTTALPPACAAAALASLKIVQREPDGSARRGRLAKLAAHVKAELEAMQFNCGERGVSHSPIIPVILGDSARAIAAAQVLREHKIYVPAIRPPTVPPNTARLRLSLMATHTDAQIAHLLDTMRLLKS